MPSHLRDREILQRFVYSCTEQTLDHDAAAAAGPGVRTGLKTAETKSGILCEIYGMSDRLATSPGGGRWHTGGGSMGGGSAGHETSQSASSQQRPRDK